MQYIGYFYYELGCFYTANHHFSTTSHLLWINGCIKSKTTSH